MRALIAEVFGTFWLMPGGCGAAVFAAKHIGFHGVALAFGLTVLTMAFAIGLCLTLVHLISIPVTNTSVNPARSLSQALFAGAPYMAQLWLFWVAPLVGGILAGLVYRGLFENND